jgi:hypothetical protein
MLSEKAWLDYFRTKMNLAYLIPYTRRSPNKSKILKNQSEFTPEYIINLQTKELS